MPKCSENLYGKTINAICPNESVGRFVDWDGYENRSYPMCAYHARKNSGSVSDELYERDKKKCEEYLQKMKITEFKLKLESLNKKEL